MNEAVERLLGGRAPAIAALARLLCERILALFPDAVVTVDESNVGFGTDAGYKGLVFTVTPQRAWETLGIARAVGLPDPAGLLEGSGKVHRHVKVRAAADLDRPEMAALMTAALGRTSSA